MGRVLLRARDAGGVQRRTVFFKPGTVSSVFSLVQVLQVRNAVIFRKSLREQAFMPAVEVGLHDRIEPTTLLKGLRLAGNTPLLASAGVAFRPPSHLPDAEQLAVKQLGTAPIVPMRRGEEPIGFISLGRKLSDQEFEPDEIEFLAAAADTTASAIYNLALRKQAQEYQEAREIQEKLLPKQKYNHDKRLPNFTGGLVGYAGYDTIRYYESEKLTAAPADDRRLPDVLFGLYNELVVFDHVDKTIKAANPSPVATNRGSCQLTPTAALSSLRW